MDRCPDRITFGSLTAHDRAPPGRTHHPLRVLPRHRLRLRMARFALSRRNSAFRRKKVRSTARTFPTEWPNSIATGDSGGPCPILRGDDHHQISIAGLAARGFVQQGFCNAAQRRMRSLALGAGRRRNLIIVRSRKYRCVGPFPATNFFLKFEMLSVKQRARQSSSARGARELFGERTRNIDAR
jgi:hypothetical protein